jgi:penicillin amidase
MLKVQTDTYSYPHAFIADQLLAAVRTVKPKDPRTQKLIEGLKDWNGIADANSPEVSFLQATRRAAIDLLLEPFLGKETAIYQWRSTAFLQRILTDRPAKWLPPAYKNYDEILAAAADQAVVQLAMQSGSEKTEDWAWKRFNSLDMFHPLGHAGVLKWFLSITDKPQSGTSYSVRAPTKTHGPAMRFVANPGDWDNSILLIPAGQSGQLGSSHYSDQFSYWYEGKPIFAPFGDAAEARARKHTLTLKPTL